MEITFDIPENTLRKIRALNILVGGQSADVEDMLIGLLEGTIDRAILSQLELQSEAPLRGPSAAEVSARYNEDHLEERVPKRYPQQVSQQQLNANTRSARAGGVHADYSGISIGLGDMDDYETDQVTLEGEEDEYALVPSAGGITEDTLDHDLDIDDEDHEAKGEAPTFADQLNASRVGNDVFAQVAEFRDVPQPNAIRARKRKIPSKSKAKVTFFGGIEEES